MSSIKIYQGDCLEVLKKLPKESVHCVITSPPYWGLRDYGIAGQIGQEPTFDKFLVHMVHVFEEVRRVLHRSGTLWLNMGDSYNSAQSRGSYGDQSDHGYTEHGSAKKQIKGMNSKNLIGQPWKLAFALQDAGWILRSDIVWHKPNSMPESVVDRPVRAHEYMFLFSKMERYYYDAEAIREPWADDRNGDSGQLTSKYEDMPGFVTRRDKGVTSGAPMTSGRSKRDVWKIPTEAFAEAHFATFPTKLVEPCILAGTSEKGCCEKCLAPYQRIFEKEGVTTHGGPRKRADAPGAEVSPTSVFRTGEISQKVFVGWAPSCKCESKGISPCTVLDIFNGSGTTGVVASRWQRDYIGIELNPEYITIAERRIKEAVPLFNKVEVVS